MMHPRGNGPSRGIVGPGAFCFDANSDVDTKRVSAWSTIRNGAPAEAALPSGDAGAARGRALAPPERLQGRADRCAAACRSAGVVAASRVLQEAATSAKAAERAQAAAPTPATRATAAPTASGGAGETATGLRYCSTASPDAVPASFRTGSLRAATAGNPATVSATTPRRDRAANAEAT